MEISKDMMDHYGLSESDLELTMKSYLPLNVSAKCYFLKEGSISDKIGYVQSGLLRAFFYDENAKEITTAFYPAGSLVISVDSFNNQVPAKENIVAVDHSDLMVVSYKRQQELYKNVPAWNQICKDLADKKSQEMIERSVQLQTLSATERYQVFCREYPQVIQKCALRHIASYLGIDNATLSRIRKKNI